MIKKQGQDSKKEHSSLDEEIQLSGSVSEHDSIKSEKSSAQSMNLGSGKRVQMNQGGNDMNKIMPSIVRKAPQMNIMQQPKVLKRESFGP